MSGKVGWCGTARTKTHHRCHTLMIGLGAKSRMVFRGPGDGKRVDKGSSDQFRQRDFETTVTHA